MITLVWIYAMLVVGCATYLAQQGHWLFAACLLLCCLPSVKTK